MNEMIERVALTLWQKREEGFPDRVRRMRPDDIDRASGAWLKTVDEARAAIEALSEPTEAMLAAADSAIPRFEEEPDEPRMMGRDGALIVWQSMINEALK